MFLYRIYSWNLSLKDFRSVATTLFPLLIYNEICLHRGLQCSFLGLFVTYLPSHCLHASRWHPVFIIFAQLVVCCLEKGMGLLISPPFVCCLRVICNRIVCQLFHIVFGVDLARYREYGLASLHSWLDGWFLAAAVSSPPVIPHRIWQSLLCNRLELLVPVELEVERDEAKGNGLRAKDRD